jgi:hypothetical protein
VKNEHPADRLVRLLRAAIKSPKEKEADALLQALRNHRLLQHPDQARCRACVPIWEKYARLERALKHR